MYFPRITLALVLIATLMTDTTEAVQLHRKGKGKGIFSKIASKLGGKKKQARASGPLLMQVNVMRPYGQPITTKLPYEPWPYDHRYIGMTAREVITKFKSSTFPVRNFPSNLLDATVDEIYQKSAKLHFKTCTFAMQLLQKEKYDKVRKIRAENYYRPPKRPGFFQRLNRMRRSTKLGIKRNGLKRICGLTGKTRDTVRVNILVTEQVPSAEVFVMLPEEDLMTGDAQQQTNSQPHHQTQFPSDASWQWLGKIQQQRFASYTLPASALLRVQSLWDNVHNTNNATVVEYSPKHRDIRLTPATLSLAIGKHDIMDTDTKEVLQWWHLNGTAATVIGNTDHSDQLFRTQFNVDDLSEKVKKWQETCVDDNFACARPDRNFVMAKLALNESVWSPTQQQIIDGALADSREAHLKYPRFTPQGHKRSRISTGLRGALAAWYSSARTTARPEEMPLVSGGVASAESDTWMLTLPEELHDRVRQECMKQLYKWTRRSHVLEFTALYGVRVYRAGSMLHVHTDRPMTHVLSCILNVHSKGPQWALTIQGFDDEFADIVLEEGELLLYESASSPHGRVGRLGEGGEVANVFIHFKPQGWPQQFLRDEQPSSSRQFCGLFTMSESGIPEVVENPEGLRHGTFLFPNGGLYCGEYILEQVGRSQPGEGDETAPDTGAVEYRKVIHGKGEYRIHGSHFKGTWQRGRRLRGTQTFKNGDTYTGYFNHTRGTDEQSSPETHRYQGHGTYTWSMPRGRHQREQSYEGMWHDGKMHGFGTYSHFVEGVNCKTFQGVSLHGSFDSGIDRQDQTTVTEYMHWYRNLLEPGVAKAALNLNENINMLIGEGLNPESPARTDLATKLLMKCCERATGEEGSDEEDVWTLNPEGSVEAPACVTARGALPTVRGLLVRAKLIGAVATSLEPAKQDGQSEGKDAPKACTVLNDSDVCGRVNSPQHCIAHQVLRVAVTYPDPQGASTVPIEGYIDFININKDAVDGSTCDWRILHVDSGYEDRLDEKTEFEALTSAGNKTKKK
ncbi:hypothetical protein FOL47_006106 [Perkinsus chesapeaki]|uniref:MORN repeat containing n=1 Tax=Perkinsus chesapeaki TaxID=330153 RepID=A0A7J6MXV5_PERCH|nr:hypothetical protein FOL47_006106 [Perkinsus chesapeaki]